MKEQPQTISTHVRSVIYALVCSVLLVAFATPIKTNAYVNPAYYPHYDDCTTVTSGTSGRSIVTIDESSGDVIVNGVNVGAPNVRAAFLYLASNLPSIEDVDETKAKIHAAGVVGNLMVESGLSISPTADNGSHYGIAQWDYNDRWGGANGAEVWITNNYSADDVHTFKAQIAYVIQELSTRESAALGFLTQTNSVKDAAIAINNKYERSGGAAEQERVKRAEAVYSAFSGLPVSATSASISTTNNGDACAYITGGTTSGSNTSFLRSNLECSTETGKAKILCEAIRYDGVEYELGGGHQGYSAFLTKCPTPNTGNKNCELDCSGLLMISVSAAFISGNTPNWTSAGFKNNEYSGWWQEVGLSDIQPGDVLWREGHIGIFSHYDENSGKIVVFQAASEEFGVGYSDYGQWNKAFTYVGSMGVVAI